MYRVERRPVLVLAITLLLSVPIMPIELWLIQELIDRIQAWTAPESILPIMITVGWLASLMLVNNIVLGVPMPMAMTRLNELGALEGQRLLLSKTARLPLTTVEAPRYKDLRERSSHISLYELYNTSLHLFQVSLQVVLLLAVVWVYGQWLPALVMCIATPLLLIVSGNSVVGMERVTREQASSRRMVRHYAGLMTGRESSKEVRLFGLGDVLMQRWTSLLEAQTKETRTAFRAAELRRLMPQLGLALMSAIILALLVLMPGSVELSVGEFTLLFLALNKVLSLLDSMMQQGVALRSHVIRWGDYREYMALEEAEDADCLVRDGSAEEEEDASSSHFPAGLWLQANRLTYRYANATSDAIHDVSLAIPIGCRAAVVGENGSGKSTLVKLLSGLYTPDEGEVVWRDDKGSRIEKAASSGNRVSAVFQDFTKLYMTLRENIALGKLEAIRHDHALHRALQSTDAGHSFRDLDIQLGASFGGIEPSGGEWQKIVTARALVREAAFVFFDEPTAALDPQAEKEAFELFLRVTERRSAMLVTHRLGAARLADLIFVLKDGELIEQGTHNDLMEQQGEYFRMFQLQSAWYV